MGGRILNILLEMWSMNPIAHDAPPQAAGRKSWRVCPFGPHISCSPRVARLAAHQTLLNEPTNVRWETCVSRRAVVIFQDQ